MDVLTEELILDKCQPNPRKIILFPLRTDLQERDRSLRENRMNNHGLFLSDKNVFTSAKQPKKKRNYPC